MGHGNISTGTNSISIEAVHTLQHLNNGKAVEVLRMSQDPWIRSASSQHNSTIAWLGAVSIPTKRLGQWPFLAARLCSGSTSAKPRLVLLTWRPEGVADNLWWWWSTQWTVDVAKGESIVAEKRLPAFMSTPTAGDARPWNGHGLDIPIA